MRYAVIVDENRQQKNGEFHNKRGQNEKEGMDIVVSADSACGDCGSRFF